MTPKVAAKAIEFLRAFRQRKAMYVDRVDVPNVESFLTGFRIGCMAAGLVRDHGPWNRASEQRGWACGSMSPTDVMREREMEDETIMDELVEIEILSLRLLTMDESEPTEEGPGVTDSPTSRVHLPPAPG